MDLSYSFPEQVFLPPKCISTGYIDCCFRTLLKQKIWMVTRVWQFIKPVWLENVTADYGHRNKGLKSY
jgi:hypothetical protein